MPHTAFLAERSVDPFRQAVIVIGGIMAMIVDEGVVMIIVIIVEMIMLMIATRSVRGLMSIFVHETGAYAATRGYLEVSAPLIGTHQIAIWKERGGESLPLRPSL